MTYLGLDIGGSHCRHVFLPAGVGPSGIGSGVQPMVHGEAAAVQQLAVMLSNLAGARRVEQAVVGMAGAGERGLAERLAAGLRASGVAFPVLVTTDVLAAAATALAGGPGALLWSGTGSFAIARDAQGRLHRTGGRGFLLGDEGSGYDLVRNAARAALAAADGRGPATLLTGALSEAFAVPSPVRLGAALQRLDTGAVAARLPAVLAVAAAGDAVALRVLDDGATSLVALAAAVAARAALSSHNAVALGGGVLRNATLFRTRVEALLAARGARVRLIDDEFAAAHGAAALAEAWHRQQTPLATWLTDDAP